MNEPLTTPLPFSIGGMCNGYRIVRQLGKGGMGIALEAIQVSLDRRVCLKFVRPSRSDNAMAMKLFEKEAKALARLNHPHIVTVYDVGNFEGFSYIVMELVDGLPLNEYVQAHELGFDFVLDVIQRVGGALAYVHENNIVHRDIKPTNVLINKMGLPKLADFGVAKILDNDLGVTDTGGVGTSFFVAPEVMQGKRYDHRADIYSMGVMAFYLMTGRLPQQGQKPSELNPDLPDEVDAVILKAMAPRPADRYELTKTFVNDLVALFYSTDYQNQAMVARSPSNLVPIADINDAGTVLGGPIMEPSTGHEQVEGAASPATTPERRSAADLPKLAINPLPAAPRPSGEQPMLGSAPAPQADPVAPLATAPPPAPASTTAPDKKRSLLVPAIGLGALAVVGLGLWMVLGRSGERPPVADPPRTDNPATVANAAALPVNPRTVDIEILPPATPTPTPTASSPTPGPSPATIATPPAVELPTQTWAFAGPLPTASRHYSFLAMSVRGLLAATFNNTPNENGSTEVFLIDPATGAERTLVTLKAGSSKGISGLAVDDDRQAVFVCFDGGAPASSGVYRYSLSGVAAAGFGDGGRVTLDRRALGCVVHEGKLYVLVDWGRMVALDADTGVPQGEPIVLQSGAFLRDLAVHGDTFAAFGNGTYVERRLAAAGPGTTRSLMAGATPRATEGIGVNPATGEFIVSPIDTNELLSVRGEALLASPTRSADISRHLTDFATSPDGATLYVSDFIRQRIVRFTRGGAPSAPAPASDAARHWAPYSPEAWNQATAGKPTFLALFLGDDGAASLEFRRKTLDTPELSGRLSVMPCLIAGKETPGLPPGINAKAVPPALFLLDTSGQVLARFGATSGQQEILETIKLLEVK